MANQYRGEIALVLGETALLLVPRFDRLAAIESALGKPLIEIAQDFVGDKATLAHMHRALALAAGCDPAVLDEDLLVGTGYLQARTALAHYFAGALGVMESK